MANYIKIYCKESKIREKDGTAPIVYLLRLCGKVSSITSGKFLLPKYFDNNNQRVKAGCGNSQLLNTTFRIEKEKLEAIILNLETKGIEVTFEKISAIYKKKGQEDNFITYWEKQMRLISKNKTQHAQSLRNLKKYAPNLTFQELNLNWLEGYRNHLKSKKLKVNGYAHDFRSIRFFHLRAIDDKLMTENLFGKRGFKIEKEDVQIEFLSEPEIVKLYKFLISGELSQRLHTTLFWFLFSVETSLRYSDVVRASKAILGGSANSLIRDNSLFLIQGKGKVQNRIPLTDDANDLLKLPFHQSLKVNNNRVNDDIKEVCQLIGIERHLTFHCARHTFAVSALRNGMPIKAISEIMGHKSVVVTEIYAKYQNTTLDDEMNKMNKNSKLRNSPNRKKNLLADLEEIFQTHSSNDEIINKIKSLIDNYKKE